MIYKVGDEFAQANGVNFKIVEVLPHTVATFVEPNDPGDEFKGLYWYRVEFIDALLKRKAIKKIPKRAKK